MAGGEELPVRHVGACVGVAMCVEQRVERAEISLLDIPSLRAWEREGGFQFLDVDADRMPTWVVR